MSEPEFSLTTRYAVMTEEAIDRKAIEEAGEILKRGGLVAFPTETVYGLGGDGLNPLSSKKIYAAKGRPSDNPLIIHIWRLDDLPVIAADIPESAWKLAETFWPGPLTMIFNKTEIVPHETTGGLDTVAVRFPSNKIAQELIRAGGGFIAAPSANRSGRPSPTLAKYCREDLDGRVDMIIDGGQVGIGLESTIIDLTGDHPEILRPGYITEEMLRQVLGDVRTDTALIDANSDVRPKAPGMKYRHYAPKGELTVVEGDAEAVVRRIDELVREQRAAGKRTGVICTDETLAGYNADVIRSTGKRTDEASAARELFRILREFDDEEVDVIYSESFSGKGIGQAIMNRLMKAAGQKIIRIEK